MGNQVPNYCLAVTFKAQARLYAYESAKISQGMRENRHPDFQTGFTFESNASDFSFAKS
jgi:hypothetical protein